MSDSKLYKYKVEFGVGGKKYDASSVSVSLSNNKIPSMVVTITPFRDKITTKPDINDFYTDIKDEIEQALHDGKTCYLKIKKDDKAVFEIDGWPLVSVGMTAVGASTPSGLTIIAKHPVILLARIYVGSYGTTGPELSSGRGMLEPDKLLDAIVTALNLYNDYLEARKNDTKSNEYFKNLVKLFSSNISKVTEFIESDVKKPIIGKAKLQAGLFNWIYKSLKAENHKDLWSWIIKIAAAYGCIVKPKLSNGKIEDKLVMEPVEPWKKGKYTINDSTISDFNIPSDNFKDVSGYCCTIDWGRIMACNTSLWEVSKLRALRRSNKVVVYPDIKEEPKTGDSLVQVSLPEWVYSTVNSVKNSPSLYPDAKGKVKDAKSPGLKGSNASSKLHIKSLLDEEDVSQYIQYCIQVNHRADKGIMIRGPIMFDDPDIAPGEVCYVTSQGGKVFASSIESVLHTLDASKSTASTTIKGTAYRTSEGGDFDITPAFEDSKSKLYNE